MMKNKFKIGDKVRLLDNGAYTEFKLGQIFTVSKIAENSSMPAIYLEESKSQGLMYEYRFELVSNSFTTDDKKILTLPTDSDARKEIPMFSGCIKYFPAALAGIAKISKAGNDKHNPGQELHHDRSKSLDHPDCVVRHLTDVADLIAKLERGENTNPEQILAEVSALAWRALAYSQSLHEKYDGAPLAPGAKNEK